MQKSRRTVLKQLAVASTTFAIPANLRADLNKADANVKLRFGLIADVHIGFVKGAEQRLDAFLKEMQQVNPNGLIQLGDFAFPNEKHQKIVDRFNAATKHPIHVIGNHELDHQLTREHAKKSWGIPGYYYSREVNGVNLIVLDGNDRGSPTYHQHGGYHSYIGKDQKAWLKRELADAKLPVLILSHQPLAGDWCVDNGKEIQNLLSEHKEKILLAINGHSHLDQHQEVDGVNYVHINSASYYWLGGKVRLATYKGPLFSVLTIDPQKGTIQIKGAQTQWGSGTPEQAKYFQDPKRKHLEPYVKPRISERKF